MSRNPMDHAPTLREALDELLEMAEDRLDVEDCGDSGRVRPNTWMRAAMILRDAISNLEAGRYAAELQPRKEV